MMHWTNNIPVFDQGKIVAMIILFSRKQMGHLNSGYLQHM